MTLVGRRLLHLLMMTGGIMKRCCVTESSPCKNENVLTATSGSAMVVEVEVDWVVFDVCVLKLVLQMQRYSQHIGRRHHR